MIALVITAAVSLVLLGGGLGFLLTRYVEQEGDATPAPKTSPAAVTAISEACALIGRYVQLDSIYILYVQPDGIVYNL